MATVSTWLDPLAARRAIVDTSYHRLPQRNRRRCCQRRSRVSLLACHWTAIAGGSDRASSGAASDLATRRADALEIIDEMKQNLWLDRGTRAVFIDFTVYNANINMFCVVRW